MHRATLIIDVSECTQNLLLVLNVTLEAHMLLKHLYLVAEFVKVILLRCVFDLSYSNRSAVSLDNPSDQQKVSWILLADVRVLN